MAFPAVSGYGNLPNGNFSPTIFSRKAQLAFRKRSVAEDVTNSSYFGEIANFGDSVRIIKEPEIEVRTYQRGKEVTPQDLEDDDYTLVIDQANEFAFQIDDIEAAHSHVDFMSMASDRAAYRIKDKYDEDVLGYAAGYTKATGTWVARTTAPGTLADETADADELYASHKLDASDFGSGSSGEGIVVGTSGTYDASPIEVMNRVSRLMDELSVPAEGRWLVMDPYFKELLLDENSKLVNEDYNPGGGEGLNNGKIARNMIRGFRIYQSNNLPYIGTKNTTATTGARDSTNFNVLLFGHDSAVATASQINKTEQLRSHTTFADVIRGLHLYGRKILRPEGLFRAIYNPLT